ncbi:MAG TPA: UDP-N-acetylmuramoyl-tripeptide--D-alanyl-D-alanine ligase [Gemmatimonadaceae bacterium]|nr:UDP-N-acetylmuramoyl-tripeptide--D-alanyl-D-alanine ligase [Gemmatimonadaceae bacterium]
MSSLFWTLDRVAAALEHCSNVSLPRGPLALAGVTTDTRSIQAGQLFVALRGERFDGHDYLESAVAAGAAAVVVSSSRPLGILGVPVFQVADTLVALGALASYWRKAWGRTVVAVAGSNGKTTTKDLIRAALGEEIRVHATTGNLNNRIGVPLTLLATPVEAELAVIELGTNIPGEVAILREIARPEISVVTSVAEEHLEGLGDLAGVLREETACYDGVAVGIAPASQPEIGEAAKGKAERVVIAGLELGDVRPRAWKLHADGRGTIELNGVSVSPPLRGLHNLENTMLAIAVGDVCGVTHQAMAAGIARMPAPKMRVAWETLGRATLINDTYNANPGSTRAAIGLLSGVGDGRQRVIVLGTMRELGAASDKCHDDISRLALDSGAQVVAGVGDFAESLQRVRPADERVITARSVEELWPLLAPRLEPDAVILLKASRGVQLEQLVPHLTTWATQ